MRKKLNVCFIILTAVMLLVPVLLLNTRPNQISVVENRRLAEPVGFESGLSIWMRGLEDSLNDRLGFREGMVSVYGELIANVLHARNPQVIVGKEGWLFYQGDLESYVGHNYSQEQVDEIAEVLLEMDRICREHDSQLIFMVGPNKSSVYSQYMPAFIHPAETTLLDAVMERLETEGIWVVHPKQELLAHRDEKELYMKLDTHWNAYGSVYAAKQLAELVGAQWQEVPVTESRQETGDLLSMLAVKSVGYESLYAEAEANADCVVENMENNKDLVLHNENGASFVCYRDSFSMALVSYYGYLFDGIVYQNWSFAELEEFPDYVVFECVERFMENAVIGQKPELGMAP